MAKALRVLIYVVVVITCFDCVMWICDRFMRSAGERGMRVAEEIRRKSADTDRSLSLATAALSKHIQQNKRIPRKLTEVNGSEYWKTDGWGNEMRIEKTAGSVKIVSAGPDGAFLTDDDVLSEPINGAK